MSTIVSGRRSHARAIAMLFPALLATAAPAAACDVCAVYTATEQRQGRPGPYIGVAEQLTRFTTLQRDGAEVPNVADERLTSSITQVLLGYNLTPRFGVQLNLPIISRTFRRLEDGRIAHDDETGIGDLSLLGTANAFTRVGEETVFRVTLLGGLKLPTGDSSRLSEELDEGHHHASGKHARAPESSRITFPPSRESPPEHPPASSRAASTATISRSGPARSTA